MWFIKSEIGTNGLNDPKKNQIVNYLDPIILKSNFSNDIYLSGAEEIMFLDDSSDFNQEVFGITGKEGNYELKWCFTKNKIKIDLSDNCSSKYLNW